MKQNEVLDPFSCRGQEKTDETRNGRKIDNFEWESESYSVKTKDNAGKMEMNKWQFRIIHSTRAQM